MTRLPSGLDKNSYTKLPGITFNREIGGSYYLINNTFGFGPASLIYLFNLFINIYILCVEIRLL